MQSTLSEAEKALDLQSVLNQAKPATDAAQGALDTATPLVLKFVNFLTHSDAATLAQYGLGAGAIYFLVRPDLAPQRHFFTTRASVKRGCRIHVCCIHDNVTSHK